MDPRGNDIFSQLQVIEKIPSFFAREEGYDIGKLMLIQEIEGTMNKYAKDKSVIPNVCPI